MLGDVLRLSWSISLGSLLPSSLRLRPSKLSRSEGDCGRGSSCYRKGRAVFPFSLPFLLPLDLGPPLHKIISPHSTLLCHDVMNTLAEAHSPAIWGFPHSPYILNYSLAASLISLLVKPYSFLKCPFQAPSPHSQMNPNHCLPPAHIHPPLNSFTPLTSQKPFILKKATSAFSL